MPGRVVKYRSIPAGDRLHQGEIVSGLIQTNQNLATIGTDDPKIDETLHPFAIILTQDCELEQDFTARGAGEANRLLRNVLFCEAIATVELKTVAPQQKDLWKKVMQNLDPRFQCLEFVPSEQDAAAQGVPSLGCDFKRFFTVPTTEVYRRIELAQISRRCYLVTPYAEHLLSRFSSFLARVPLPENHNPELSA